MFIKSIDYETHIRNFEAQKSNSISELGTQINSEITTSNSNSPLRKLSIVNDGGFIKDIYEDLEFATETQYYSENYQKIFVDSFIKQLFSDTEVDVETMGKIMELVYNNPKFSKLLIDFILRDRKNLYIKFNNFNNLQHFANILSTVSLNLDGTPSENYELNFAIIYIAERAFYDPKDENDYNKIYLSAILSKNKLYSTRSFWMTLIEIKLTKRLEEQISRYQRQLRSGSKDISNSPLRPRKESGSIFGTLTSKIKTIFGTPESPIEVGYSPTTGKYIKNYETLSQNKKNYIDKMTGDELCIIIKDYIFHFANFNFQVSEAIDLIVELCTKYKIQKEKVGYFVNILNSSVYTVKNKLKINYLALEKRKKSLSNMSKNNEYKTNCMVNIFKYLPSKEYVNLLVLNKGSSKKLSQKLYREILSQDNISIKLRLRIWEILLKVVCNLIY
jgi:hypothetical protein